MELIVIGLSSLAIVLTSLANPAFDKSRFLSVSFNSWTYFREISLLLINLLSIGLRNGVSWLKKLGGFGVVYSGHSPSIAGWRMVVSSSSSSSTSMGAATGVE